MIDMQPEWEAELATFLDELLHLQDELLEVLRQKQQALAQADTAMLASLEPRETHLVERFQAVHAQRAGFLERASQHGMQASTLRSLRDALPLGDRQALKQQFAESATKARLIQHRSLTNWVLTQRMLLHLSQVLEIIATGGRLQPTYGKGTSSTSAGSLVDHAA